MGIFKFKQFDVDQTGCAMKVNTDGALLGALAQHADPRTVLDIGTGTGVIALMLAQRYPNARINALEIDIEAEATASRNFQNSTFSSQLESHCTSFQDFLASVEEKYDLIVSNPPFFLNSLKNPNQKKTIARHTSKGFFKELISSAAITLSPNGQLVMIIPVEIAGYMISLAETGGLMLQKRIVIKSFSGSTGHRDILSFGFAKQEPKVSSFIIYEQEKQYSAQYIAALKDFFTIF